MMERKPMIISRASTLAFLSIAVSVATFFTNKSTMKNLLLTTRKFTPSLNHLEAIHHGTPTLSEPEPIFHSYRIFDIPDDEISRLGVLDWPKLCESLSADESNFSWTERVPAGVMITRYIAEGTVQLTMRNEVSSAGRFMGAGSLIDIAGPVTLTWAPKHDDEQVVIRVPSGNEPDKLLVVAGAFTIICGVLLARRLSSFS